jgi:hypothetical protein
LRLKAGAWQRLIAGCYSWLLQPFIRDVGFHCGTTYSRKRRCQSFRRPFNQRSESLSAAFALIWLLDHYGEALAKDVLL